MKVQFTPPAKSNSALKNSILMTQLPKHLILLFAFLITARNASSQLNIEWPSAIVEMHYNNTGPDVNEYIEIHFHYTDHPFYFPCICHLLSELRFFNQSGVLYKTITPAMMSVFSVGGWGGGYGPHGFGYYHFPPGEDFADEGKVQFINIDIVFGTATIMAEYTYNGSGITEQRQSTSRFFPTGENETTPIGSSLNFCGYYYSAMWNAYIMASSYGSYNSCLVLPVNLTSFNYTLVNNSVRLQWQTASEYNTDKFEVEKSIDGINFNKIGTVASAGTSNTARDYSFPDNNPAAINYYRIRQVDKDGKAVYSKILNVKFKNGNPLTIQPTIVTDQLRVNIGLEQREIKGFQVYDISGRAVLNAAGRSGYNEIDVSNFSAGSYLIRLQTADGKAYSQRFVKQ